MADNDRNSGNPEDPEDLFDEKKGPKEDDVHKKDGGSGGDGNEGGGEIPPENGESAPVEWASPEDELYALRVVAKVLYDQNETLRGHLRRSSGISLALANQQAKLDRDIAKRFAALNEDFLKLAKTQDDLQNEGIKLAEAHANLIDKHLALASEYIKLSVYATTMASAIDGLKINAAIFVAVALVVGFAGGLFIHRLPALIDSISFWLR